MGCAPSKGKLFSKPEHVGCQKALLAEMPQHVDHRPEVVEDTCLKTEEKDDELPVLPEERTAETTWTELDSDTAATQNTKNIKETEENLTPKEIINDIREDKLREKESQKKTKGKKRSSEKQRKSFNAQTKVEFPPQMVRAHQAAYTFLNPNISKYKILLGLLDQAAQTQMSLQPMMTALVFQFEEVNQALEEMAEEGELMLMEHGDYMALPSGMLGQTIRSTKPTTNTTNHIDPPPDLVQQLLQHSAENMRQVRSSVQALGDKTLEEAVEYFSSLSKLLANKLEAKQAAEQRLAQIFTHVEGAAVRKLSAEDAALHSEDSGIGGENESLTGSEKHHRGSAGSCGSGGNIQGALDNYPYGLANTADHNEDDEEEEEDEDQDEGEDEYLRPERKRSNSSPPDPSQTFRYLNVNCFQDQQPTIQRPLTATKPEHSSSNNSNNVTAELQRSLKEGNKNTQNVWKAQGVTELARPNNNLNRFGMKRHSLNGSAGAYRGLERTNHKSSLPVISNQQQKRPSVKRLINTFSQGVNERPGLSNTPPHVRRSNKTLMASDAVNSNKRCFNGRNNNNSWPDGRDDLDMDNLPPPPLEVLMDNSFQSNEGQPQNEEELQRDSVHSLPVINQKTGNYHQRRIPMQNLELLPNRANVKPRQITITPTSAVGQESVTGVRLETDPETEKANCLYQQARKIIHLRNAAESTDKTNTAPGYSQSASLRARMGQRFESNETYECEMSCSLPVTAPPVSRVRLPPSGPPVCHRFPSPPVYRPQSTSRPTSRPNSPRSIISARDKAPEEIMSSVSFKDARSFFCQNEAHSSQTYISSRGRLPTRGLNGSNHRTQSEKRPAGSSHQEFETNFTMVSGQRE